MCWSRRTVQWLGVCVLALAGAWGIFLGSAHAQAPTDTSSEGPPRTDSAAAPQRAAEPAMSRAERWRQKRRAKRQEIRPPESGVFDWVGDFFARIDGATTPRRLILSIPQLEVEGVKPVIKKLQNVEGGLLYRPPLLNTERRLVSLEATTSLEQKHSAEVLVGYEAGGYVGYAYGRYRHRPVEEFYGVGSQSTLADKSGYRRDEGIFGGLFGFSPIAHTLVGGHVSYQINRVGEGKGGLPSARDRFGDVLRGFDGGADYFMVGTFFEYDSRDAPYERAFGRRFAPTNRRLRSVSVEATRGFYVAAEVNHNVGRRERDVDFTSFTVDMREFLPFEDRLLYGFVFRQFAVLTRSSSAQIPFYRMQTLGGGRSLRGYEKNRFRDRNAILVNAEIRSEIWHWLDMALFTDVGHVFRNFENVEVLAPRVGYGVGFRVKNDGETLGRVDVGRSTEGIRTTITLGSLF